MRIEVLIGNDDPIIFPIRSSKILLGSGEGCDIILPSENISRKHLIVYRENDKFYVADQGSTNGSFVNEERLVPGRKVEFTSFFPVRLGAHILVSLISEEEALEEHFQEPTPEERTSFTTDESDYRHETTSVINLKELKSTKTESLVKERDQKREVRKKTVREKKLPPKVPEKKFNPVYVLGVLTIAAAAYYNLYVIAPDAVVSDPPVPEVVASVAPAPVEPIPGPTPVEDPLVPEADLPTKEFATKLLADAKCAIEEEIYLCDLIPGAKGGIYGAVKVGLTMYLLIDGGPYFEQARALVSTPTDVEQVRATAGYLFLSRVLPKLNEELLKDSPLMIGFVLPVEKEAEKVDTIIAIYPKVFNLRKENLNEGQLRYLKSGINAFGFTKDIYRLY